MSFNKNAAGVLIAAAPTGRVLLALRSAHVRSPGTWGAPGGGIDRGETAEEAAAREVWEEAGIDVDPDDLELLHQQTKKGGGLYTTFLLVIDRELRPRLNDESDAYGWFHPTKKDLPRPLHPGARRLFEEVDVQAAIDDW